MRAATTIVLYREEDKRVIAEVFEGQNYEIPEDVSVYEGTLQEFLTENTEYVYEN